MDSGEVRFSLTSGDFPDGLTAAADERGVRAVHDGGKDLESFEQFVVGSRDRLLRALAAHHGPEIGAESLADAYAYAWNNWERVRSLANPVGFVFRVGDRAGARRVMRARREPPVDTSVVGSAASGTVSVWFDDAVDVDLIHSLRHLPPRQRAAVLLVHGYGWSYKEAASTMDVPISTLTNDLHRGLAALRILLADERADHGYPNR